ncbi:MAG: hypothetical protein IJ268_04020 [Proteobacteria bacterium]|nr:hypothetical protein [Pseudomonadota bacterium]
MRYAGFFIVPVARGFHTDVEHSHNQGGHLTHCVNICVIFPFAENGQSGLTEFFRLQKMAKAGLRNFSVCRKWPKRAYGIFPFAKNGQSGLAEFFRLQKALFCMRGYELSAFRIRDVLSCGREKYGGVSA